MMQVIDVLGLQIRVLNVWFFYILIKLVVDLLVRLVGVFGIVTLKVLLRSYTIPGKFSSSDTGRGVIKLLPGRSADISVCVKGLQSGETPVDPVLFNSFSSCCWALVLP